MLETLPLITVTLTLALLPFGLILLTAFTRISIILAFLKQAIGLQVPSTQVMLALSLILTTFVMHPVIRDIYKNAYLPLSETSMEPSKKFEKFIDKSWPQLRNFMMKQTREKDLGLFLDLSSHEASSHEEIPWYCVIPAFVISELKTAFLLGFLLFLPFLVIDLMISTLLMSLGMAMIPPLLISLPFKILLFVLVDGWHLIVQQIVTSYQ